ncbi:hypothetical protein EDB92DRAFT_1820137 [Lactarius akahatsu]|uniref:Uncharacterized protein n=1 Tax=Lactarius akahatsu TaxID=416441 RepID=A0AAD4Q6A5_9AGAM|nr:hypothetical protein EDB92DRAFT_1820137 [Lactarius akahatsu]
MSALSTLAKSLAPESNLGNAGEDSLGPATTLTEQSTPLHGRHPQAHPHLLHPSISVAFLAPPRRAIRVVRRAAPRDKNWREVSPVRGEMKPSTRHMRAAKTKGDSLNITIGVRVARGHCYQRSPLGMCPVPTQQYQASPNQFLRELSQELENSFAVTAFANLRYRVNLVAITSSNHTLLACRVASSFRRALSSNSESRGRDTKTPKVVKPQFHQTFPSGVSHFDYGIITTPHRPTLSSQPNEYSHQCRALCPGSMTVGDRLQSVVDAASEERG